MKIKSYFSKTVDEAMAQARAELGAEALILNTRRFTQGGRPAGYEVVVGMAEPPQVEETPKISPDALATEFEKLRTQMDELQALLVRTASQPAKKSRSIPEITAIYNRLIASEVEPQLSHDITERVEGLMMTPDSETAASVAETGGGWNTPGPEPARLEAVLRAELIRRVRIQPQIGVDAGTLGAVAMMVGPSGSGKSSAVAKLATTASAQWPVRVVSLGQASPVVQSLSDRGRVKFTTVDSLEKLAGLVADVRKKECVLIDTPGAAAAVPELADSLAAFVEQCPEIDVHLVIPAYIKAVDLRRAIQRYDLFRPAKLLVSKLDETQTFGTPFSEAARNGLALSFLTHGPRVPEDIRPAAPEDLLALALTKSRARAHHAA